MNVNYVTYREHGEIRTKRVGICAGCKVHKDLPRYRGVHGIIDYYCKEC